MTDNKAHDIDYVKNLLEDESRKSEKRALLNEFIERAITNPKNIEPEEIYFIGVLLFRLIDTDFKDPRKVLGLPSKQDQIRIKTFVKYNQLIADVNYLISNGQAKGAQGACKLLAKSSPFYKGTYEDENSLQATYRKAIQQICKWWKIDEDNILNLDKKDTAISKGKQILSNSIFHINRDPLK